MQDQVDYMPHKGGEIYRKENAVGAVKWWEGNLGQSDVPLGAQVRSAECLAGCKYVAHTGYIPVPKVAQFCCVQLQPLTRVGERC
jgi:hypothetical protein